MGVVIFTFFDLECLADVYHAMQTVLRGFLNRAEMRKYVPGSYYIEISRQNR